MKKHIPSAYESLPKVEAILRTTILEGEKKGKERKAALFRASQKTQLEVRKKKSTAVPQ